ncbi:uncharacterized protein [Palaemon carinicauda]|uniref:uncharacterized protein n=1 Tax=Palaemon carinicauda TaxID=392227 RepID=UPI0035B5EE9B
MAVAMNSSSSKECEICNEFFNENRHCPRVLPCSHCICNQCAEYLITINRKICPFCRKVFNVHSAKDLGTNSALLSVLKYVKELESSLLSNPVNLIGSRIPTLLKAYKADNMKIYKESYDNCNMAVGHLRASIQRNRIVRESLSDVRTTIKNELNPVLMEIENSAELHINFLDKVTDMLELQIASIDMQKGIIGDIKDRMEEASCFSQVDPIMQETEGMVSTTNDIVEDIETFLAKEKKTCDAIKEGTKKVAGKLKGMKGILTSGAKYFDLSMELVAMAIVEDVPKYLPITYLKKMKKPVWNVLQKGRVLAVKIHQGKKKYAQITRKGDNQFCLHHLGHVPPTDEFHVVDYDDLMKSINTPPELTFLELGIDSNYLGQLLIRLSPADTNKARQFSLMCTGEMGPTYANTNCLGVVNKGDDTEVAGFGDYENNDCSGGKTIIPHVNWEEEDLKEEYKKPLVAGLLGSIASKDTATIFGICLRDNPVRKLLGCYGKVEEGLEVLRDAIVTYPDMKKCRIMDCGIVFSL